MSELARCRGCKRRLQRRSETGYGPRCWRKLRGQAQALILASLAGQVPDVDGQLAFDAFDLRPLPSPDLRDQKASDRELWAATTVPVNARYL